ncbi:MAG: C4-dicarboxylate TRAP transporter substrate-binding protein [Jhaorihella sp.]
MKLKTVVAVTTAILISGAASAQEQLKFKYNLFAPPRHPIAQDSILPMVDALKEASGGTVIVDPIFGGALFGAAETLDGLKGRGTETGYVVMGYYPAAFRYGTLVSNLALIGSEPLAASAAVTELSMLACAPCQEEYRKQNIVYLGGHSTGVYSLISKDPVDSLAALEGKRIRAAGSVWDRWLRTVGAVPVNVPTSEMFDGLNRGILDGAIVAPSALRSQSLWDASKYLNQGPLGTYIAAILVAANMDFYRELSVEQRKLLIEAAAQGGFDATWGYVSADSEVIDQAGEHGVTVQPLGDDVVESFKRFNEADLAELPTMMEESLGIEGAADIVGTYQELYQKWEDKLRAADALADKDKAAALFIEDVISRIELSTYGL